MLDAYIIKRIRQERERQDSGLQPLRIEVPRHPSEMDPRWSPTEPEASRDDKPERGIAIIDYSI